MGGRICSMAIAEGLPAAAVVLLSYPLHPPGKPERLRIDHFPALAVPSLFVNGDRDPFGTPAELAEHIPAIAGPVESTGSRGSAMTPSPASTTRSSRWSAGSSRASSLGSMLDRIESLENELRDVEIRLGDPAVQSDSRQLADLGRRFKQLEAVVAVAERLRARPTTLSSSGRCCRRPRATSARRCGPRSSGLRPRSSPTRSSCGSCCCRPTPTAVAA